VANASPFSKNGLSPPMKPHRQRWRWEWCWQRVVALIVWAALSLYCLAMLAGFFE
jgi:hypothetical protein